MINSQAVLFLIFAFNGLIIGIIFDSFRILRKSFSTGYVLTTIEDIAFWILTGIILLYSIFTYNNGVIRGYMFLGVILGVSLYMLMLSKLFITVNVKIIGFIKKIVMVCMKPIKVLFRPIIYLLNLLMKKINKAKK